MPAIRAEHCTWQARSPDLRQYGKLPLLALVVFLALVIGGCGAGDSGPTPSSSRSATQTPWIVYVPVTTTPEPAIVTPLPTITTVAARTPTRTPTTRPAVVPTKAAALPTKSPTQPAAVVVPPSATALPACSASSVTLVDPKNGDPRRTKESGPGSDTFRFKWLPFQPSDSDPTMGYRIDIESRKGSTRVNGDTVYVGHNDFLANGQLYIYDSRKIYNLASPAGGQDVIVTWKVTVIKTTGKYDSQGGMSGTAVDCGPSSPAWTINLLVVS